MLPFQKRVTPTPKISPRQLPRSGASPCPARKAGHMRTVSIVLLVIAAICAVLVLFGVPSRVNLLAVGLLAVVITLLIPSLT